MSAENKKVVPEANQKPKYVNNIVAWASIVAALGIAFGIAAFIIR